MKIIYKKVPGKNHGLHFEADDHRTGAGFDVKVAEKVKSFVNYNATWLNAPYNSESHKAHPFIQSDCDSYLFIEFWSAPPKHKAYVEVLFKELGIALSEIEGWYCMQGDA